MVLACALIATSVTAKECYEDDSDSYCTRAKDNLEKNKTGTCDESDLDGVYQCSFCPCSCLEGKCGSLKWTDTDGGGDGGEPTDFPFGEAETESPTGVGETRSPTQDMLDIGEPFLAPTPVPTPSPTSSPFTNNPTLAPSDEQCAKNCGDGTCRSDDINVCTSCSDGRVVANGKYEDGTRFGRCVKSLACRARKILSGPLTNETCKCTLEHCHYCKRTSEGEVCNRCRDGWYMLNDICVEDCPPAMTKAGTNLFGRQCLDPFTCKSGRSLNEEQATGCKCADPDDDSKPDADCHTCEFEAGKRGQKCTRCRSNKFLNTKTFTCDAPADCDGLDNVIPYKVGSYGAACRAPFTCTSKRDDQDEKCKCSKTLGKCVVCTWGFNGNNCITCGSNKYLKDGKCVDDCGLLTPVGDQKTGRECK